MSFHADGHKGEQNERHGGDDGHHTTQLELIAAVSHKEERKLAARQAKEGSVWFGLGMFGMIGWSVAVPALLCVALGVWIDARWPSRFSWTLMLLLLGMALGCLNAWFWVTRERRQIGSSHPEQTE